MYKFQLIFIISAILINKCSYAQNLRIFDICSPENHVCLKLEYCPRLLEPIKNGFRPKICSFIGKEPIICCVDEPTSAKQQASETPDDTSQFYVNTQSLTSRTTPSFTASISNGEKRISARMCEKFSNELCPNSIPFVIGGDPALAKELPFMAMVGYGIAPNIRWNCAGSLISPRYVLSAGHCSTNGKPKYVRLGELDYASLLDDAQPQQIEIDEIYIHPNFKSTLPYNDIAIYRLNKDAVLNEYVRPICLNQLPSLNKAGTNVIGAGWGYTSFNNSGNAMLNRVDLELFDTKGCNRDEYSRLFPKGINESSMLCAGSQEEGKDVCKGDSGGPLFLQPSEKQIKSQCFLFTQVGITSFGYDCGRKDYPAIYTNVNYFLPWIESIVWP